LISTFLLLSLGQYLCWYLRFYYYHSVNTSVDIYAFITIPRSIPLLISSFILLSLGWNLYWWTISSRVYHPQSIQCFYHSVNTSVDIYVFIAIPRSIPLLISTFVLLSLGRYLCWYLRFYYYHSGNTFVDIYVFITIPWSIPLLISTFLLLSLGRYLCWYLRFFTIPRSIPLLISTFLLLSLGQYLCWYLRFYYYPSIDTSVDIFVYITISWLKLLLVNY
jgi:hypothetical protein